MCKSLGETMEPVTTPESPDWNGGRFVVISAGAADMEFSGLLLGMRPSKGSL